LGPEEQKIIAVPDFKRRKMKEGDDFMILGCDGVWET